MDAREFLSSLEVNKTTVCTVEDSILEISKIPNYERKYINNLVCDRYVEEYLTGSTTQLLNFFVGVLSKDIGTLNNTAGFIERETNMVYLFSLTRYKGKNINSVDTIILPATKLPTNIGIALSTSRLVGEDVEEIELEEKDYKILRDIIGLKDVEEIELVEKDYKISRDIIGLKDKKETSQFYEDLAEHLYSIFTKYCKGSDVVALVNEKYNYCYLTLLSVKYKEPIKGISHGMLYKQEKYRYTLYGILEVKNLDPRFTGIN